MNAAGVSRVAGLKHIDRGYESPEAVFAALGAEIKRKEVKDAEQQKKQTQQTQEK